MIQFAVTFPITTRRAEVFAPAIRHMIAAAEEWLGPAFDPPFVDAVSIVPGRRWSCVQYGQCCLRARIELAECVRSDPRCLAFHLAHECIHLLAPGPASRDATNLEEGLAVEFSMRYTAEQFGTDGWLYANDITTRGEYEAAWSAVRRLLAADDRIIERLRERQPVIPYIDADLIQEFAPDTEDATFLAAAFPDILK